MKVRLGDAIVLPTGITQLDRLLNGGISIGKMSHIYGEDGSGKSTFALQIAVFVLKKGGDVLWVDFTGSFSQKKLTKMTGSQKNILTRFHYTRPIKEEEYKNIVTLIRHNIKANTRLLVLDPITYKHALYSRGTKKFSEHRDLYDKKIPQLAMLVLKHDLHILLVNNVRGDFEKGTVAIGAKELNKFCKYVFRIENPQDRPELRYIMVERLQGKDINLKIPCILTPMGLKGVNHV